MTRCVKFVSTWYQAPSRGNHSCRTHITGCKIKWIYLRFPFQQWELVLAQKVTKICNCSRFQMCNNFVDAPFYGELIVQPQCYLIECLEKHNAEIKRMSLVHCKKRWVVPSRYIYVQLLKQLANIFTNVKQWCFTNQCRTLMMISKQGLENAS